MPLEETGRSSATGTEERSMSLNDVERDIIEPIYEGERMGISSDTISSDLAVISVKIDEDIVDSLTGLVVKRNSFRNVHKPDLTSIPRFTAFNNYKNNIIINKLSY